MSYQIPQPKTGLDEYLKGVAEKEEKATQARQEAQNLRTDDGEPFFVAMGVQLW